MKPFIAVFALAVAVPSSQALAQTAETRAQPIASESVAGKHADVQDQAVLEALLLSVCADKDFPAPPADDKSEIILHERNPETIEQIINVSEVSFDTGHKDLPKDAWDDMIRRNVVRLSPNSREISYAGLQFDPKIQVANAFPGPKPPFQGKSFEEVYPTARGWVSAWVPGFSKDHRTAVVRAQVGPAGHFATMTAILKRQSDKWVVVWRRYSVYS